MLCRKLQARSSATENWGFGQVLSRQLMEKLMDKASDGRHCVGLAATVSSYRSTRRNTLKWPLQKNMSAIICANTHGAAQRVAPVGGKRPTYSALTRCASACLAARTDRSYWTLGSSATAEGKVRVKKIAGEKVPDGWVLDPEGNPTNDPHQLYGDPPGTILPMGGDQAYKGFGLSLHDRNALRSFVRRSMRGIPIRPHQSVTLHSSS